MLCQDSGNYADLMTRKWPGQSDQNPSEQFMEKIKERMQYTALTYQRMVF